MTPFPKAFVEGIVYLSIILTVAGVGTLIALLIRDLRTGKLW